MRPNRPILEPKPDFPGLVGRWVLAFSVLYVAYYVVGFIGRPVPASRVLLLLVGSGPLALTLIIPPSVFAAALHRFDPSGRESRGHWVWLGMLSLVAYVIPAFVEPLLAVWTGSDWLFPAELLREAREASTAAQEAVGRNATRHLRQAGTHWASLIVPVAMSILVVLAALLGARIGQATKEMGIWSRYVARWLSGGALVAAFWVPLSLADELVVYRSAPAVLLFLMPLAIPLLAVLVFAIVRSARGRRP